MARSRPGGGRTTPKGRPPHLHPVAGHEALAPHPLDDLIDEGGRELLEIDSAVDAEIWGSAMLHFLEVLRDQLHDRGAEVSVLADLYQRCQQRGDRAAAVVVAALAAVAPPPADRTGQLLADQLATAAGAPDWAALVGRATPTRAWLAGDVWGDQEHLLVSFRQPGAPGEHLLVALVDHVLSGRVSDCYVSDDSTVDTWRDAVEASGGVLALRDAPVEVVLGRLRDAMATTEFEAADEIDDDVADHWAMVWARLRRAGLDDHQPERAALDDAERAAIVAGFMASPEAAAMVTPKVEAEVVAQAVVGLRADFDGQPLRWSPSVVEELAELIPADAGGESVPDVLRALVRYGGRLAGLEERFVAETVDAVGGALGDHG